MTSGKGKRSRITRWLGHEESENQSEVPLSVLIQRYLTEKLPEYAVVLYFIAARGPIKRKTIIEIARLVNPDTTSAAIKSWLSYMVMQRYLARIGHGMYTIGPKIRKDVDRAREILRSAGIDLETIEELVGLRVKLDVFEKLSEKLREELLNKIIQEVDSRVPGFKTCAELLRKDPGFAKLIEYYTKDRDGVLKALYAYKLLREKNFIVDLLIDFARDVSYYLTLEDKARSLSQEVEQLREERKRLLKEVTELRKRLEAAYGTISNLNARVTELEQLVSLCIPVLGRDLRPYTRTYEFVVSRWPKRTLVVEVYGYQAAHIILTGIEQLSQEKPVPEDVIRRVLEQLERTGLAERYDVVRT